MDSILSFLSLALSGFIGGLTVKYIDFFFKNSNDKLEKLEKAFLLTSSIVSFTNQSTFFVMIFIYCETNKLSTDVLKQIKIVDNPLPQLSFLINFHLQMPKEITSQLQNLENLLIEATKPMASPFLNTSSTEDLNKTAINQCLIAKELSRSLNERLKEWILEERDKIRNQIDFTALLKLWINYLSNWITKRLKKYT